MRQRKTDAEVPPESNVGDSRPVSEMTQAHENATDCWCHPRELEPGVWVHRCPGCQHIPCDCTLGLQ